MSAESDAIDTLNKPGKPDVLARAAQVLAASTNTADQKALLDFLKSPANQQRLDPPSEPFTGADDRWIARPIRSLAGNDSVPARGTLVALMADSDFIKDLDHADLLMTASIQLRPPAPAVIAFWRKYPANPMMAAVMENGDPLAVAEFERLLVSFGPPRDPDDGDARVDWLRGPFLKHRDNPAVVSMAQRLLAKATPPNWDRAIQLKMAEALFSWNGEWYRPHHSIEPPSLAKTPSAARQTLRAIGEQVRKDLSPPPALEAAIAATMKALDALPK